MHLALLLAASLAAPPPEGALPEASTVEAMAAELRAAPTSGVPALVAGDPRYAALSSAERAALLRSLAISPGWRVGETAANVIVGFGSGSLVAGDWRGLILTATDLVAFTAIIVALVDTTASAAAGESSPTAATAAPLATGLLVAGRIAGAVLPWTWDGRRHAAAAEALGRLPPPRAALRVAPLVASATGRLAPGATLVLRF